MARKFPTITDEQQKAWSATIDEEMEKRLKMIRERQAYFSAVAEECETFDDFIKAQKMWLDIMGIELYQENPLYLSLRIQLDYTDYETYHIVKGNDGKLTVSDIIL